LEKLTRLLRGIFAAWGLCVRIVFETVDDARDAVFNEWHVKVDEQPQALVCETEVSQQLLFMNRRQILDGFHFDDYLVLDDQIRSESGIDADVFINDRYLLLAHDAKTAAAQFVGEDRIVDGFQQARPEGCMDAKGCVDNLFGDGIFRQNKINFSRSREDAKNASAIRTWLIPLATPT